MDEGVGHGVFVFCLHILIEAVNQICQRMPAE